MKRLAATFLICGLAAGCSLFQTEEAILSREDISLTWRGELQVSYDAASFQIGFNDHNNEYRIYDDKLANWFVLTCSEKPVCPDQTFKAKVSWTGQKGTMNMKNLEFKVMKTEEDGRFWLWNDSNKIGIIVQDII